MLRFLRIRNLAVIEAVEVEFEAGFNVLTGETGAGKSILVEAVGLLLGARASADLVRTGEALATIEAIFEDGDRELIVRREISSQGRSRSYVNGALATAAALRDLSACLVELHGQHEHQALLDPLTHLPLLDQFAELGALADQTADRFVDLRAARERLERSRMDTRERVARLDLINFQLSEFESVAPRPGEDDELDASRRVLVSAERIQRLCEESYSALYDSDQAVLGALGGVWKRIGELSDIDPQFTQYVDARDGIKSQLEDLAFFLRAYSDAVDASPARLQELDERLARLERLKKKHGPSLEAAIDTWRSLTRERDLLTGGDAQIGDLEQAVEAATQAFLAVAGELSRKRRAGAAAFDRRIEALLGELAMARTRFETRLNDLPLPPSAWAERGIDSGEFYVSPNPGEELRPLARIVSGGEMSRVMLALKTLLVAETAGKTLIFDEVDAGIGGRVADVVGARLHALGDRFQVLCITHLPQIAARGDVQFRIVKDVRGRRTLTSVERLDAEERVEEIARMLGGAGVTDAVRAGARDLLSGGIAAPDKSEGESERRKRKSVRA